MAINIRCHCSNEASLKCKQCPQCGSIFSQKNRKYKVTVRCNGRKITRTLTNLSVAREIESKLKLDSIRGEYRLEKKVAPTLAEVWKAYDLWGKENKPKSIRTDQGYYGKHLEPRFTRKRLDNISPIDIERMMSELRKGKSMRGRPYSKTTIKHIVVLLGRLYSFAQGRGMYSGTNPCKRVKKPALNNQITERLTDEQLYRLHDTLDEWPDKMSASFIRFLLYTGLRRGELFKLTWDDIDFERRAVTLRDPKGRIDTTLPLSDKALAVLEELPREYDTSFVFYGKDGQQRVDFSGPWKRIRKAAELPKGFRLHGLRHHFASSLVNSGVDLYTVSKLLTHKDVKTTQRYAHLADQTLRNAVSLSDKLQERKVKKIQMRQHNG